MANKIIDLNTDNDIHAIIAAVMEKAERKRREIAMTFLQQVSVVNPVDTGRLRVAWTPSLNVPSDWVPDAGKYSFPDVAGKANQAWGKSKYTDVIYITNNVPYAVMVDNGTVRMAPRRFVERTITIVSNKYS